MSKRKVITTTITTEYYDNSDDEKPKRTTSKTSTKTIKYDDSSDDDEHDYGKAKDKGSSKSRGDGYEPKSKLSKADIARMKQQEREERESRLNKDKKKKKYDDSDDGVMITINIKKQQANHKQERRKYHVQMIQMVVMMDTHQRKGNQRGRRLRKRNENQVGVMTKIKLHQKRVQQRHR